MPLFLQFASGASATDSGLLLLPLTVGVLAVSLFAGPLIVRLGRIKWFGVGAVALSAAGVGLFSTLGPDAGRYLSAVYLVVLGIGFGLWMQVFTLAVQNTAPARDMGASMSTLSFARQVGGALGAAAFGAIFASRLAAELASRLPADASGRLFSGSGSLTPEAIRGLPEAVRDGVTAGYAAALSTVFLVAAAVLAVGLIVALFMKKVPSGEPPGPRVETASDGEEP